MTRTFIRPIGPVGLSLALAALAVSDTAAGTYQSGSGGLESTAQRELVRRQEDLAAARQRIVTGDRAMADKDYETAYLSYLDAVDMIGSGPAVTSERAEALGKFSSAGVAYAEELIASGRYSEAEQVAKTILLQQYNPTYQPAIRLLSHLEQPDYYNKTVTPRLAAKRDDVSRLLTEADGYYARGSFDTALKRYEEVLSLDRYNIAAQKGIEKVNLARTSYYNEAYNETRSRMLWQVTDGWRMPKRRYFGGKDTIDSGAYDSTSRNEQIIAKLNQIIVPSIELQDMTIRDAVDLLRQLSQRLDTMEADPAKKGVNIFLSLGSGSSAGPALGTGDLLPPAPGEEAAPAAPVVTEDTTITLSLTNVPLYEALRYVASLAGLKIKIDPVAVSIVPMTDVSNELVTKEYRVPPNFIPSSSGAALDTTTFSFDDTTEENRMGARMTARDYLESLGVDFPEGASAQYISTGSRLLIRNTQDNIDFIDTIVDAARGAAPTQVEIESKFVEVNQNNLKELGFDWLMGPMSIGGGVYGAGGDLAASGDYPFVEPGQNSPIGTNTLTRGLRSGTGTGPNAGVSVNGLDGLLSGITSGGVAPGIFSLAGIYTNPQFQVVIRALDQKKGIDLLSAPKVTARSGERAVVNIIREFRYPTEFDPPQIPQSVGTTGGVLSTAISTGFTTSPIITPTTPAAFETRNLGVTLEVTPVVGPDGYTIDLDLSPEVIDFDGFVNYGTPIRSIASVGGIGGIGAQPVSVIVSDNVINQPVFSTRKVTTNITIWDGMTVALGGLIREDVQKVQDKVPFLGDVPLVGRLFRTDIDQKLKKNLIVFVTAKLIDAEGKPLRSEFDQEEIVEPLGLPEEIAPPVYQVKGSAYK